MNGSMVVIEVCYAVFGTCLLYSQNRIKSIELVRRSGFRQGYGSCTSVVIEYQCAVPGGSRSVLCSFRNLSFCIPKIVSNLSNLFEDPDSIRDTGHALVLLLNTYERFQGGNRSIFYSFRNLFLFVFLCVFMFGTYLV